MRRGRLLRSGPSYKALVVDDQTSLPEVAAERLVGLARAGLPVVIYGRPPTAGVGFKGARGEDATVKAAIRRLRTLPNVRSASSPGALLRALRSSPVRPDFLPRRATAIVPVHRRTAAGDVWFLYNDSPRRARAVVSFATSGAPTEVDLWTGRATRLGRSVRHGRRVTLPVTLAAGDTALLTFDRRRGRHRGRSAGRGGFPDRWPSAGPGAYPRSARTGFTGPRAATLLACAVALLAAPAVGASAGAGAGDTASGPAAVAGASCPNVVNAASFTSKAQLRRMTAKFNSFGPRILGSSAHNKAIAWLAKNARAAGLSIRSRPFKPYGWFPRTGFKRGPGLDIGAAGGLSVTRSGGSSVNVPDAGAVHWSKPTSGSGEGGPLAYLAPDQEITAANAAGRVIVRDFPIGSLPFGAVGPLLGVYLTPDLEGYTEYTRPYLATLHEELIAAGQAGARESYLPSTCRASRFAVITTRTWARSTGFRRCSSAVPRPRSSRRSRRRAAPPA